MPDVPGPPSQLDGADVFMWADVSDRRKSPRMRHFADGVEQTRFERVAIAQYRGKPGVYLFHCNADWQVENDDFLDSVDEAVREAKRQYEGLGRSDLVSITERGPAAAVIDLEAATLSAVVQRPEYVAACFDALPCYGWQTGEKPELLPLFRCEIRVWDGQIERLDVALPYEMNDDEHLPEGVEAIGWELRSHLGIRHCFLPAGFAEDGPVRLVFGPYDSPTIVITGSRVSLEIGEQVDTFECWPIEDAGS